MATTIQRPGRYESSTGWSFVRQNGSVSSAEYPWSHSWIDQRTGSDNPQYKAQIRKGVQAATSLTGVKTNVKRKPYLLSAVRVMNPGKTASSTAIMSWVSYGTPNPGVPSDPSSLSTVLANNRALEQLVRKIRKEQTTWQGGVFLGEFLQTVALIANPAKALRKGVDEAVQQLRGFRYRNRSKSDLLKFARDKWLETQLGWAPLIAEIDDGAKAVAESRWMSEYYRPRKSIRAIGVDEQVVHYLKNTTTPSATNLNYWLHIKQTSKVTVRYISCIDAGTYALADTRRIGLDLANFVPTVWELIPFSFVIDYFTNIGDVLSAASLAKSSVRWTVKTVRKECIREAYTGPPNVPSGGTTSRVILTQQTPGKASITRHYVTRDPYTGDLVPDFRFNLPTSYKQWLNVAALVHSRGEIRSYMT